MPRRSSRTPTTPSDPVTEAANALYGETDVMRVARVGRPFRHAHARFAPSSAYRWLACPLSVPLAEQVAAEPGYVEPPAGAAADLGTRAHDYADRVLRSETPPSDVPGDVSPLIDRYLQHVRDLQRDLDTLGSERFELFEERLVTGISDCWGTVDTVVACETTREVWIIDLKTGRERVAAEENPQLLVYAIGAKRRFPWARKFHLQIVQPRDEEQVVKTWTCDADYVSGFRTRVAQAVRLVTDRSEAALSLAEAYVTGDHCTYCPAASRCPALQQRTLAVFDAGSVEESRPVQDFSAPRGTAPLPTPNVEQLTAQQQAFFLEHRDLIRRFLSAVEDRARNNPPAGWKVVEGRSRRRWRNAGDFVELLQATAPSLLRTTPPTIAEAERVLGRAAVAEHTEAPPGNPQLVPETDPRPAIDPASRAFRIEQPDEG